MTGWFAELPRTPVRPTCSSRRHDADRPASVVQMQFTHGRSPWAKATAPIAKWVSAGMENGATTPTFQQLIET